MSPHEAVSASRFSWRSRLAFLALVICQALHSLEEYSTRLYDRLAPARFISGLVSDDLRVGFATLNLGVVALGVWSLVLFRGSAGRAAWIVAWIWVVVELANGAGHFALAVDAGGYFPGVLTAPLLIAAASALAVFLRRDSLESAST